MPVFNNILAGAAGQSGGAAADYTIQRSLRFDSDASSYLSKTPSGAGNRKTWTWSGWVKRSKLGTEDGLFVCSDSNGNSEYATLYFNSANELKTTAFAGTSIEWRLTTNRVFRDPSAWMHIVLAVDTTQATNSNRVKLYINGVRETSFRQEDYPAQNFQGRVNKTEPHAIGSASPYNTWYGDFSLADIHFVDGQQLDPDGVFGEFNATTGVWSPIEFTGDHGPTPVSYSDNGQTDLNDGNVYLNTQPVGNIFDGDDTTYSRINRGTNSNPRATFIWQPTGGISGVTKIRIKYDYCSRYQINNGTWANVNNNGGYQEIYNGSAFTLTTLKIQRTDASGSDFGIFVYAVEINDTLISNVNNNGFHLDFSDNSSNSALGNDAAGSNNWTINNIDSGAVVPNQAFQTVLYTGTGSSRTVNCGFKPDFVWIKSRANARSHMLFDSVRGPQKRIMSHDNAAEDTDSSTLTAFTSNGFTVNTNSAVNLNNEDYVAWCWKAGGTASTNNDGSITSSVSASSAYGFSVTKFTGDGSGTGTIGHGLTNGAPKWIILKDLTNAYDWLVYTQQIDGSNDYLKLNTTDGKSDSSFSAPTSSVFSYATDSADYVAYCWSEVAGFSKFGSWTGSGTGGSNGPTITLGFRPRYVVFKRADQAGDAWTVLDTARDSDVLNIGLYANADNAELTFGNRSIQVSDTGFQVTSTGSSSNASGGKYIYAAFADGGPTGIDSLIDSPTNADASSGNNIGNYATLNPIYKQSEVQLANGNLDVTWSGGQGHAAYSTIAMYSGKYYFEITSGGNTSIGIRRTNKSAGNWPGTDGAGYGYAPNGQKVNSGTYSNFGTAHSNGDVIGVAFDADTGKLWFSHNGTWQGSGDPAAGSNPAYTVSVNSAQYGWYASVGYWTSPGTNVNSFNAGQRSFHSTPPTGFLSLCAQNLGSPLIANPSKAFDILTWQGDGSGARTVSGLNLLDAPDLVWSKTRNQGYHHNLFDSVRGYGTSATGLITDYLGSANGGTLNSATASSLTFSGGVWHNENARTYVAWAWDAGSSTASNTDGTITTSVKASQTNGFSIATYTGNGSANQTLGHSLGAAPAFVIIKCITESQNWAVMHTSSPVVGTLDGGTEYRMLELGSTAAASDYSYDVIWHPTSTTVKIGEAATSAHWVNKSGEDYVMYAWAPVESYSAFGKYIGNSGQNFQHLGFKPRWIMIKNVTSTNFTAYTGWAIFDTEREPFNVNVNALFANKSQQEELRGNGSSASAPDFGIDILSNGFCLRDNGASEINLSGETYVYAAFASSPFQYARAL